MKILSVLIVLGLGITLARPSMAVMPKDLTTLMKTYNDLILPDHEQDEAEMRLTTVKLERSFLPVGKIIQDAIKNHGGNSITSFQSDYIDGYGISNQEYRKNIMSILFNEYAPPFFCATFRQLAHETNYGNEMNKKCRHLVYKLLGQAMSDKSIEYYVNIKGNNYGDFQVIELFVTSKEKEAKVALKYTFDIVHEI